MRLQAKYKWLPTPFRTILLFAVWLLLNNSVSPGHLILGAVLAIVIPLSIAPFRKPQPLILRPGLAFKQLLIVLWDIITANVEVAIKILGPSKRLRPLR